jgi:hypothetical protein
MTISDMIIKCVFIHLSGKIIKRFPRSQAPAWERICARSPGFSPSPVTGSRGFTGKCVPKPGLGNENEKKCFFIQLSGKIIKRFPRSQAPAWERICARSPSFGPSPVTGSRGFTGKCVPKPGLGNEKKNVWEREKNVFLYSYRAK